MLPGLVTKQQAVYISTDYSKVRITFGLAQLATN